VSQPLLFRKILLCIGLADLERRESVDI